MKNYVKPTSDLFIRYLLGSEENIDILLDFINTMLTDLEFAPAISLTIRNPFNLKDLPDAKESILDVKARDETGRTFDVEIQVFGNATYTSRSLYYWAKLYESQLKDGELYHRLNPVICLNILDFILFQDIDQVHTCFMPTEISNREYVLTDHMQIHFLELQKVDPRKSSELTSRLQRWIYFLRAEGSEKEEEMKILLKDDPVFEKAHRVYETFTADDRLVELHEARMKRIRDEASLIEGARIEGMEQGIEKGIQEGEKHILVNLQEKGYTTQQIAELTGIEEADVHRLLGT